MSAAAQPLVSIITPAWNAARFIGQTIESVLAQTAPSYEMLIADDCSTDDTRDIIRAYASQDARVVLVTCEQNGGPAAARNAALDRARGRYIAFLDSDDFWLPRKLERQLDVMQSTGAAITYTRFTRVDADGVPVSPSIPVPPSLGYRDLLKNTAIATSTAVVDQQQTGPFRMQRTYYDDFALWVELLGRGFTARAVPEDLARYRVVEGSWSRNKLHSAYRMWREYIQVPGLHFFAANWYFMHYAWNAVNKYHRLPLEEVPVE